MLRTFARKKTRPLSPHTLYVFFARRIVYFERRFASEGLRSITLGGLAAPPSSPRRRRGGWGWLGEEGRLERAGQPWRSDELCPLYHKVQERMNSRIRLKKIQRRREMINSRRIISTLGCSHKQARAGKYGMSLPDSVRYRRMRMFISSDENAILLQRTFYARAEGWKGIIDYFGKIEAPNIIQII